MSVQKAGSEVVIGKPQESLTVEEASDHPRNGQSPRLRRVNGSLMETRAMQSHRPIFHPVMRARERSIRANRVPIR